MFDLLFFLFGLSSAQAQQVTCATRPAGDSTNACASTAFVNGGSGNVIPVPAGGTGRTSFAANLPLIGNGTGPIAQGTVSGNTTLFPVVDAMPVNGQCATWDSYGGLTSTACSPSGSGTVGSGLVGQLAQYPSNGTSVVGVSPASLGLYSITNYGGASTTNPGGTCSATASNATLTCSSTADFGAGQGIRINHAGPSFARNQVTGASATPCGGAGAGWPCTAGSTTYTYTIISLDNAGGAGVPISTFSTSTGPASLSAQQFVQLNWTLPSGTAPAGYAICGRTGGSLTLIGIATGTTWTDYGPANLTAPTTEDWISNSQCTAGTSLADWLITTVSSLVPNTSITVAAAPSNSVGSETVKHDNNAQIAAALSASNIAYIPCGTYQISAGPIELNVNQAIIGGGRSCTSISMTTDTIGNFTFSAGGNDITFSGVALHGNDHASSLSWGLLDTVNITGGLISDNLFDGFTWGGIAINWSSQIQVVNNIISRTVNGQNTNQCINTSPAGGEPSLIEIRGNICVNSGIFVDGHNIHIDGNQIFGFGFGSGIVMGPDSGTSVNTISNNIIQGGSANPDVNYTYMACIENWSPYTVITGNNGSYCAGDGIDNQATGVSIAGNIMWNNGTAGHAGKQAGISIYYISGATDMNGSGTTITGNTVFDTGPHTETVGIQYQSTILLTAICSSGNSSWGVSTNVSNPGPATINNCF